MIFSRATCRRCPGSGAGRQVYAAGRVDHQWHGAVELRTTSGCPVDAPASAPGRKIQHSPMLDTGFWSATHTQAPATRQERRQLRRLRMRREPRAAIEPEAESKVSVITRAGRDAARRDSPVRACGGSGQPGREIPRERVRRRSLLTRPGGKAISRIRLADAPYAVRLATVSAPGTAGGAEFQPAGLFGAR